MQLVSSAKILLFLPSEQIFTQSVSQTPESPKFVSAEMSFQEFAHRLAPLGK